MDRKKKITKGLKTINEGGPIDAKELEANIDNLVDIAGNSLGIDEPEAKSFVAGIVGEGDGVVSRGIEHGMNPEVQADEYEDYRALMNQLASDEGETPIDEGNDPVKLKNDVARVLGKLDMSSIQPYLVKIDNPTEQAEMIGQFAEKIGVPRAKLTAIIAQLKITSKAEQNGAPQNTANENIKTNKNVIRTVKVKDIK